MTEYIDRTGEPDDVFEREVLARVSDPVTAPQPATPGSDSVHAQIAEELRPGERWEWGVKHNQGIRTEPSEVHARASLEWLTAAYEKNYRNTVKPVIVRRRVSEWEPGTNPSEEQS